MKSVMYRENERGTKDLGWLLSKFTFSFSSYQDPVKNGFGLLKVFNDDFVETGKGFGLHAHMNMEIISVMLQGKMNHKDSMGYSEMVDKDWVQIMSAGSGIRHEEYNVGDEDVRFLQYGLSQNCKTLYRDIKKGFFQKKKERTNCRP